MYLKRLKIGDLELENNVVLAPMAGITDLAFRMICKEFGVGLVCTEMVSAKAIFYNDKKTKEILNMKKEKRPILAQIFGSDIEAMKAAAEYVSSFCDVLDINMGCPAPKVVKNGDGSKLLLDLDLLGEITQTVVKYSKVPVTVKIRKGWDDKNIVAVEAAKVIEQAGASLITVHGRTKDQYYSGLVDFDIIKKVKETVTIPVIGNGDIKSVQDAKKMFEYTNVDGIMIGRAALGNPWILREMTHFLKTGQELPKPNPKEKLEIIIKHINLEVEQKGELVGIKELRKHITAYVKHLKESSRIRETINTIETKKELVDCLTEYFNLI